MLKLSFEKKIGEDSIKLDLAKDDDQFLLSLEDSLLTDSNLKIGGNISDLKNLLEDKTPNNDIKLLGD